MAGRKVWVKARTNAGMSQRDVDLWFARNYPDIGDLGLDASKLGRFERGGSAKVAPVTLVLLAECYGRPLRDIDPEAAEAYKRTRDLVISTRGCVTADDTRAMVAA